MSLLTDPKDLAEKKTFVGLVYGQPGVGRTTLALSAPNPMCLDFDRGMTRVQAQYRVPSLQVETYDQALELLNSEEVEVFDTIVIDTLGELIDRIAEYVARQNPRLRQADGQMSPKGWGGVKKTFGDFVRLLQSKNKSLLFVAHESEEKEGDNVKKRPDCSGSAKKDIVKKLDFMGYMEMVGNNRTITFNPTEAFYAKNSLELEGHIKIPSTEKGNTFIAKHIVKLSAERLQKEAEMRAQYDSLIKMIEMNIANLKTVDDVNDYYEEMGSKEIIWDSAMREKRILNDRITELNFVFNVNTRKFEDTTSSNSTSNEEEKPEVKEEDNASDNTNAA